ncbi:hypothetical protein [Mycoplasmopsis cynos]|uniref:Uncharacterized protein n=1 Tax=Mycoplasmopsis cynos (strain C142) TaxID=1246955 RepID=L0RYD9_MYCC1|nr:hypothetical protein [Mycoplasmopsis cynos]UWV92581.1 hypothetical protein NWE57_00360 [Mycoplasmopsis cynos]CCP24515.1 Hypothetical protein MCYN_0783 [Mycoplasmopsis cynos C142]
MIGATIPPNKNELNNMSFERFFIIFPYLYFVIDVKIITITIYFVYVGTEETLWVL